MPKSKKKKKNKKRKNKNASKLNNISKKKKINTSNEEEYKIPLHLMSRPLYDEKRCIEQEYDIVLVLEEAVKDEQIFNNFLTLTPEFLKLFHQCRLNLLNKLKGINVDKVYNSCPAYYSLCNNETKYLIKYVEDSFMPKMNKIYLIHMLHYMRVKEFETGNKTWHVAITDIAQKIKVTCNDIARNFEFPVTIFD